jgi:hypothetical protein
MNLISDISRTLSQSHQSYILLASNDERLLDLHSRSTHEYGLAVKNNKNSTPTTINKRFCEESYWRKFIIKKVLSRIEHLAQINGQLGKQEQQQCCTDYTLQILRYKDALTLKSMSKRFLVRQANNSISVFSLSEVIEKNTTNNKHDTYITMKTLEEIASRKKYTWTFFTLTCPPEHHSNPTTSRNHYNNELTFKLSAKYLNEEMFYKLQKRLDKKYTRGEDYAGIKVLEPHDDGCPHMHVLLFHSPHMYIDLESAVRAAYEKGDRPSDYFDRYKEQIMRREDKSMKNPAKAASYIYKYLSFGISNKDGCNDHLAERYRAAFRAANVRQYAFVGVKKTRTKRRHLKKSKYTHSKDTGYLTALAESLFVDKSDQDRNTKQINANINFLLEEHENITLTRSLTVNRYGEQVHKITGIKHAKDIGCAVTTGLTQEITQGQAQALMGNSEFLKRVTMQVIATTKPNAPQETITHNYSSKAKETTHIA